VTSSLRRYFSAGEVARIADVSYRRLDLWCRRGIITPSRRIATGKGQRRLFTFRDIIEVRTLKSLTAHGVRLSALLECVTQIRRELSDADQNSFARMRLVTDGKKIFRYVPAVDHLEPLHAYGQFAFAFGLGDEIALLAERAMRLDRNSRYMHARARKLSNGTSSA